MDRIGIPLYIIDGYNVVFHPLFSSDRKDISRDRERLLRALDSYASKKRVEITVVWDGGPPDMGRTGTRARSIFSGEGGSADERIVRIVERARSRGRITVVSDDRRHIREVVKGLGAGVLQVEEFLSLIGYMPAKKRKKRTSQKADDDQKQVVNDLSVEDWMRLFRSGRK